MTIENIGRIDGFWRGNMDSNDGLASVRRRAGRPRQQQPSRLSQEPASSPAEHPPKPETDKREWEPIEPTEEIRNLLNMSKAKFSRALKLTSTGYSNYFKQGQIIGTAAMAAKLLFIE